MNLKERIEHLGLSETFDWVMENNTSKNLPYHNNYHLQMVCETALKGCDAYHTAFDYEVKKLVAVAALFHDMNHTGSNDDENIQIAVESFENYNKEFNLFSQDNENFIIELIKSTRYPYEKTPYDLTLAQNILRDSDILQGHFTDDYLKRTVFALREEGVIKTNKMVSLENQIKFLGSLKFGTHWANQLHEENYQRLVDIINEELHYERTMTRNFPPAITRDNNFTSIKTTLGEHLSEAKENIKEISIELYKFEVFDKEYHIVLESDQEPYVRDFINRIMETKSNDEINEIKNDVATKYMLTKDGFNQTILDRMINMSNGVGRNSIRIFSHLDRAENDLKSIIEMKRRDDKINKLIG